MLSFVRGPSQPGRRSAAGGAMHQGAGGRAGALQHGHRLIHSSHPLRDTLSAIFIACRAVDRGRGFWNMNSGQLVLVTLHNPREKFWGVMIALTPAGVSL